MFHEPAQPQSLIIVALIVGSFRGLAWAIRLHHFERFVIANATMKQIFTLPHTTHTRRVITTALCSGVAQKGCLAFAGCSVVKLEIIVHAIHPNELVSILPRLLWFGPKRARLSILGSFGRALCGASLKRQWELRFVTKNRVHFGARPCCLAAALALDNIGVTKALLCWHATQRFTANTIGRDRDQVIVPGTPFTLLLLGAWRSVLGCFFRAAWLGAIPSTKIRRVAQGQHEIVLVQSNQHQEGFDTFIVPYLFNGAVVSGWMV